MYPKACHIHSNTAEHLRPWAALNTSVQPAVPGLLDQHGDHLSPGEGQ